MAASPPVHVFCFPVTLGPRPRPSVLHTHPFHEIYLNTGGTGWQWTDTAEYAMKPADLFLFPSGQPHGASAAEPGPTDAIVLNFDDALLAPEIEADREAREVLRHLVRASREGHHRIAPSEAGRAACGRILAEMAAEQKRKAPGFRCHAKLRLMELLLLLLRDPEAGPSAVGTLAPAPAEERLADVLRYIETRFMDPITVEAMAAMACLSRSHFHAVFRQETGYSPVAYIHAVRVRQAEQMLRQTRLPILQVALACGFPSLSHFYHVFGAHTGKTPRAARTG